jgi:hypothetical protein
MLTLILTVLSVSCGIFSIIFHVLHLQHNKKFTKPEKKYNKISILFRILTLVFLVLSMIFVHLNLTVDHHPIKTRGLKIVNLSLFLIPIAIIELIISFL